MEGFFPKSEVTCVQTWQLGKLKAPTEPQSSLGVRAFGFMLLCLSMYLDDGIALSP